MNQNEVDILDNLSIMTAEEVAKFLKKSQSWVYQNWQELGGVKLKGSLLFPSKEELYERLFGKKERVEVRFHQQRQSVHGFMVQNQKRSQKSRSQTKRGGRKTDFLSDANRHGLFRTAEQTS